MARVHLVNPKYTRILDQPCVPTLDDLDEPVDLVMLGVPDPTLPDHLQRAADHGAGGSGLDRKTLHGKAALVKLAASEAAGRVVDRCVQIFGGRGYMRDYPVERLYRELRVDRIWEGTSEVQRLTIANEMIKRGTAGLLKLPRAD